MVMHSDGRPQPTSPAAQAAWAQSGQRHRLIDGTWEGDAEQRLRDFFDKTTYEFLPKCVLAFNTFKNFVQETCTLYDGEVTALPVDASEISQGDANALGLDLLWAHMQETLEYVRAMNDALVLRSWDPEAKAVRYLPVAPDCVEMSPDPNDPSQPARVDFYRQRPIGLMGEMMWCRDRWNKAGTFAIEVWRKDPESQAGVWRDETAAILPETANLPGMYPYWTQPPTEGEVGPFVAEGEAVPEGGRSIGRPIWPWTAYHRRITSKLLDPFHGVELVDLSLVASVLWTYWTGGLRDVAYQQRYMKDCDIAHVSQDGKSYAPANPMMVMKLKSTGAPGTGEAGAWPSPMNPREFAEAIGDFQASGAIVHGLSSADVSISNAGLSRVSGFAIEVSREGKRKVETKSVKPQSVGDRHNLAGASQLANAYGTTKLPERPEGWRLMYTHTARTPEAVKAEVEEIGALLDRGLLHPAHAMMRLHPSLTFDGAKKALADIAAFKAGETDDEAGAPSWGDALDALLAADDLDVPADIKAQLEAIGARLRAAAETDDTAAL